MLILRDKTILVDGRAIKLYSFDGRLWFSKAADFKQFKQRRQQTEAEAVKLLSKYSGVAIASSVDFWGR